MAVFPLRDLFFDSLAIIVFLHYASGGLVAFLAFPHYFINRDQAQHCCNKYGMALMSVDSQTIQDFMVSNDVAQLFDGSGKSKFWLGVFTDNTTTGVFDSRKTPLTWTNWDEPNIPPEYLDENGTFVFENPLCVTADLTNDFAWQITDCSERYGYMCTISTNLTTDGPTVDVGDQSAVTCPVLTQYKVKEIQRIGNFLHDGQTYAGTTGLFDRKDKMSDLGTQLESHIVTNYHDCLILCLNNALCNDVILVSSQVCMLYQAM